MKLVFATNNPNKLLEVQKILGNNFEIVTLKQIGFFDDIPEPHPTLQENAIEKAMTIYNKFGLNCFAEDTGLEVEALNGEPGVLSARYAGQDKAADKNIAKVLANLQSKNNRNAQFRTVAALVINGSVTTFEGIVKGKILEKPTGTGGFGYDPIFLPNGYNHSFAQMRLSIKNSISHRAIAIKKLTNHLNKLKV